MAISTQVLAGCTVCYLTGFYLYNREATPSAGAHALWLGGLGTCLVYLMRNVILVPVFLPALLIARMNHSLGSQRRRLLAQPGFRALTFRTADGVTLDGCQWSPQGSPAPGTPRRWLLWLNPNGATFEDVAETAVESYGRLDVNIVFFNYRGVGSSQGTWPRVAADLVKDSEAAMQYILQQGARPEDVLIYGWSLGGGIGAALRAKWPRGPIVSDRSFASLSVAAKFHASGPLGIVVSVALFAGLSLASFSLRFLSGSARLISGPLRYLYLLGISAQALLGSRKLPNANQRWSVLVAAALYLAAEQGIIRGVASSAGTSPGFGEKFVVLLQHFFVGEVLGMAVWASGLLGFLAPQLLRAVGWEMDAVGPWKQITGNKLILHHAHDGILPPQTSLFLATGKPDYAIELRKRYHAYGAVDPALGQAYHCYPPVEDSSQFPEIFARVRSLF